MAEAITIGPGETRRLFIQVRSSTNPSSSVGGAFTFAVSNPAVVSVSPVPGTPTQVALLGIAPGAATITVGMSGGGPAGSNTATLTVTVKNDPSPAGVSLVVVSVDSGSAPGNGGGG